MNTISDLHKDVLVGGTQVHQPNNTLFNMFHY